MNYRQLGKTGFKVSELSLGTWQLGGVWGSGFNHTSAQQILEAAYEEGVNFLTPPMCTRMGKAKRL